MDTITTKEWLAAEADLDAVIGEYEDQLAFIADFLFLPARPEDVPEGRAVR